MITAPVKGAYDGAKSGGAWGALKGFGMGAGAGIVSGAAVAVGGVATGVYQVGYCTFIYTHNHVTQSPSHNAQIGRGVYHTPGAVSASMKGQDWDDEKKMWTSYNLPNEAAEVLCMTDEEFMATLDAADIAAFEEVCGSECVVDGGGKDAG